MPKYSFACTNCGREDTIELGIKDPKKLQCADCSTDMDREFIIGDDVVCRACATPGQHATRNMQDVRLMNHIRTARAKANTRSIADQNQDAVDKYMFRKRKDSPERPRKRIKKRASTT